MKNIKLLQYLFTAQPFFKTFFILAFTAVLAIGAGKKIAIHQSVNQQTQVQQTTSNAPNLEPSEFTVASPDVSSLGKFGFSPVSKYTGSASTSVPIYTINYDGKPIPIGLSYQTGGIRVMEEGSWVGLGWNLSANAVITRGISDLDDLNSSFGYPFMPALPNFSSSTATSLNNYFLSNPNTVYDGGRRDGEPDVFVANLFGTSFKFLLDKNTLGTAATTLNGKGIDNNGRHIDIKYDVANQKFTVIDNMGYEYIFDDREYTTNVSGSSNSGGTPAQEEAQACACTNMSYSPEADVNIITGWHISEIISPKGKSISFGYTDPNNTIIESQRMRNEVYEVLACTNNLTGLPPSNGTTYSCSYSITKAIYLEQITYEDLVVDFLKSDREDILTIDDCSIAGYSIAPSKKAKKLDQISVSRNGTNLLTASFQYSYFNSSFISENNQDIRTNQIRLKLDEVSVQDKAYTFDYIQENNLPAKNSKSVDHWGFYNGKVNTQRFAGLNIPVSSCNYVLNALTPVTSNPDLCISGANKEADANFGEYGSLKEIHYPTGGSDKFNYEGHQVKLPSGFSSLASFSLPYHEAVNEYNAMAQGVDGNNHPNTNEVEIEFNSELRSGCLSDGNVTGIFINIRCNNYTNNDCTMPAMTNSPPAALQIIDANTNAIVYFEPFIDGIINTASNFNQPSHINGQPNTGGWYNDVNNKQIDVHLPAGKYKLKVYGRSPQFSTEVIAKIPNSIDVNGLGSAHFRNYEVGGLRMDNVSTYDENGQLVHKMNYKYDEDATGFSSGLLMAPVQYYGVRKLIAYNSYTDYAYYLQLKSNNTISVQNSAQGSHVGYSRVEQIQTGLNETDNEEWKIVSLFDNNSVFFNNSLTMLQNSQIINDGGLTEPIYKPIHNFEIKNGQLLEQTYWKGKTPVLVKKVENTYQKTVWNTIDVIQPNYHNTSNGKLFAVAVPYDYEISSNLLIETEETNYDDAGNPTVVTNQNIDYNTFDLPTKTTATNSDGTIYSTYTKYACDFNLSSYPPNPTNDIDISNAKRIVDVMSNNQIGVPIETKQTIQKPNETEKVIGASLSTFQKVVVNGKDFIVPHKVYIAENDVPLTNYTDAYIDLGDGKLKRDHTLKEKATSTFDNEGNVVQFQKNGDIPMSLIWNEDGTLPLAKAVNATPSEIFYTSFEEDANASPKAKTGVQSYNGSYTIPNSFTSSLPDGAYTLTYWHSTNGNTWTYQEQTIYFTNGMTISTNNASGYADEVRLYPSDALMTTYAYDANTHQLTHINSENDQVARFEYDNFHRLEHVYDFDNNLISKNEYNYRDENGSGNKIHNYIQSWTFLTDGVNGQNFQNYTGSDVSKQIQFMDGLGRPIQSIAIGQATDQGDIVSHIEYDDFGRLPKQFLPFVKTNNNGNFVNNASTAQYNYNFIKYGNQPSYAESKYDNSPLNRVIEQGALGSDWQLGSGHTMTSHWDGNGTGEVYDFENGQYFAPNKVFKTSVTDENGVTSFSYTDKLGRTIQTTRRMSIDLPSGGKSTEDVTTYYVYDDFGRVSHVIPPEATKLLPSKSWNVNHNDLADLIYTYTYDSRGRLETKKIPGAAEQYMVYDELNRIVLTQDGNLRNSNNGNTTNTNRWLFTKYDILSRPVMTGIFDNDNNKSHTDLISDVAAHATINETRSNGTDGYTNNAFPNQYAIAHSVTYYDHYDFDGNGTADFTLDNAYTTAQAFERLKGKLVGTKVKILDGGNDWLHTVTFYDDRSRILQIYAENHLGGRDITTNAYDFAGKVLETVRDHTTQDGSLVVASDFEYDHAGRLLLMNYGVGESLSAARDHNFNLSANEYDQLGQLIEKKLHSTNGINYLQNVDYKYNIRGWLTDINNVDFGGLTAAQLATQSSVGIIEKIKDSEIDIQLDVSELNAGNYNEIEVSESHTEENNGQSESESNQETLVLNMGAMQTTLTELMSLDYTGETITEANYEQEYEQLRSDLTNEMDNIGLTDQTARDLVESEVMGYFKDNWNTVVANDNDNDLFAMHFDYTNPNVTTGGVAQFNGNISQITWRVRGDANKSVYGFEYDDLNRLTNAKYSEYDDSYNFQNVDNYTVSNLSYDLNGNIQTINRRGFTGSGYGLIDQMTYTYQNNSNILQSIQDQQTNQGFKDLNNTATDYTYDDNGNMITDANKDITTIAYNYLNLPIQVTFANGKSISWQYDAAGVKLSKTTDDGTNEATKHYVGGIEYVMNASGDFFVVEAIYHSEGRLTPFEEGDYNEWQAEYTLRDHLGNARVTFADLNNNGRVDETEILQTNHYYPFGMVMEGNQVTQQGATNAYQYNGKELNADFGLDWLDYGARWYDASIARWSAVDPLAEKYYSYSSYNYVLNNPILMIDPDGRYAINTGTYRGSEAQELFANIQNAYKGNKEASNSEDKEETSNNYENFISFSHKVSFRSITKEEEKEIKAYKEKNDNRVAAAWCCSHVIVEDFIYKYKTENGLVTVTE